MERDLHADDRDLELVSEALEGHLESFGTLYKKYTAYVAGIGRHILRGTLEVEDYVQDVFTRAFEKLKSFNGAGLFRGWLSAIARNTAINKNNRAPLPEAIDPQLISDQQPAQSGFMPDFQIIAQEAMDAVRGALNELPHIYHRAISLVCLNDLSYDEASAHVGVASGTIKAQVHRGKQLLKSRLEAQSVSSGV